MPNHTPLAIANEFLRRINSTEWPSQLRIQKLTYLAHGWNLALNDKPLSNCSPEAWARGPVFREIWDHIRSHGYGRQMRMFEQEGSGDIISSNFTSEESDIIDAAWEGYGEFTPLQLTQITHRPETPWSEAYAQGQNTRLNNQTIKTHFLRLAKKDIRADLEPIEDE